MQDWKMQEQKCRGEKCKTGKCGTNFTSWFELKKNKNVLCIVVLHLYYVMLECIDYFVTAVVTSGFNW